MKMLVFGALNIDKIYQLKRFIQPGETLSVSGYSCCCGGKGFNLATAVARAGREVYLAGAVGTDGQMLVDELQRSGVNVSYLHHSKYPNGHAVIQVDENGENCIIIVGGANDDISFNYIDDVIGRFEPGDWIILQNEIANVDYLLRQASAAGMRIAFNPSPINDKLQSCDLSLVDFLFINEGEGRSLTGEASEQEILKALHFRYPAQTIILTLGHRGVQYLGANGDTLSNGALDVEVVDSTAAGDTFTGYFMAEFCQSGNATLALQKATIAGGLAVSRKGAATSIPWADDIEQTLQRINGMMVIKPSGVEYDDMTAG